MSPDPRAKVNIQCSIGGRVHCLDQVGEEGGELLGGLANGSPLELAQVNGELIHEDQHGPLAHEFPQGFCSGGAVPRRSLLQMGP